MSVTPLSKDFDIDQYFIDQFVEENTERFPVPLVDPLVPSEQEGQPEGADEHRQEGCAATFQGADVLKLKTGGGQPQSAVDQSTWIGNIVKIFPPVGVSLFLLGASFMVSCPNGAYGSPVPQSDSYTTSTTRETSSRQRRRRRVERARSARRASSVRRTTSATSQASGSINQVTPEPSVSAGQATSEPVTPIRFHNSSTPHTSNFYSPGTNAMVQYFHDASYTIDSVSTGRTEEHLNLHLKNEHGQSEHDVTLSAHLSPPGVRAKNTFRSILQ